MISQTEMLRLSDVGLNRNDFAFVDEPRVNELISLGLSNELKKEIPAGINSVFISSVAQIGLIELKDEIWKLIHNESN